MARNIRWHADFKSLNGTVCTINIYDNNWPAGVTKGVTAAADPFFFEEEDSEDILNDVLRYRTGYIRLVEQDGDYDFDSIYPTSTWDRYVEVLYGQTVVFTGYIQMQDFSSDLVPKPRVRELPVISPLGLLDQKVFTGIIPPTSKTLGELLNTTMYSDYNYVYLPKNYGNPNPITLGMKVQSTVVSPYNEDFHHSMSLGTQNNVMKGETYAYFIEAICKAFGWIAHDVPGALVFTAFDYEDEYCYYPVGHIGESGYRQDANIPATAIDLEDYFELADDQATETTLMPETGIEIDYEGDTYSQDFSFDRTYIPEQNAIITMPSESSSPDEVNSLCNLQRVDLLQEISVATILSFDTDDCLNPGNGICAWNGKEGVMCSLASYNSGTILFWVRFYFKKRSSQSYKVTYNMTGRQNGYLRQLAFSGGDVDDYYAYTQIDPTNADYVQVSFYYRWNGDHPQLPRKAVMFFTNIHLEVYEDGEPYAEYRYTPATDSEVIPAQTPQPPISNSVDMPISLYRLNEHLIGTTVRSTKLTEYPYLFAPRKNLVSKFRYIDALTFPHVRLLNYLSKKWRIIAQRFDPWNDEYQLTMQHSSVL